jgi:polysaccharide biosynthesis transport protein
MLQTGHLQRLEPSPSPYQRRADPSASEFYTECIGFLRRRFRIIAFSLLASAVLGAAYLYAAHPIYTGRALLIVDAPKVQVYQAQSSQDGPVNSATVDTQIQIIESDDIALSVIKELKLDHDPAFLADRGGLVASTTAKLTSLAEQTFWPAAAFAPTSLSAQSLALANFRRGLKVRRVDLTYAVEIEFSSSDPFRAATISNAVADAYEMNAFEAKYQITGEAAKWLQDRLEKLRGQATDAERAVVAYGTENGLVNTGGELLTKQQIAEFSSELSQARAATAEAKARLDRVQNVLNSNNTDPDAAGAVAETLRDDVINKIRTQYLQDERQANAWAAKYGTEHQAVLKLRSEMRDLQQSIFQEVKRIADSYRSDYAIAESRENSIQNSLNQLIAESQAAEKAEVTLHNLESNAQTNRALYDNFLQRYMQSVQQQSAPVIESRLITHARPPTEKSWPRSILIMVLALLGGSIFGAVLAMLRDASDRVFRTTLQISEHLQSDCIAVVPLVKGVIEPFLAFQKAKPVPSSAITEQVKGNFGTAVRALFGRIFGHGLPGSGLLFAPPRRTRARRRRKLTVENSVCWTVANAPCSRFSESIRAVKVAADDGHLDRESKAIGVTSSLPNEGKSTIAISLAALIAQGGGRAILLDCDLRNPQLTRLLTPDAKAGLLEVIAGQVEVDDVLWREPKSGLTFLPSVVTSRLAHSSDILGSEKTRQLIEHLRGHYDYVIIDLSPLAPVIDARVASRLVDSFLLVIEWGRTKIGVVQHALRNAPGVGDKSIGVVLNKANMKSFIRYSSEQDVYYSNPYYSRYGYTD